MNTANIACAGALALAAAAPAVGQDADEPDRRAEAQALCGGGAYGVLRISQIVEEGSMEGFLAARDAHEAWYRERGVEDNAQVVLRVLEPDRATGDLVMSEDVVLAIHVAPPNDAPERDEAWDAFVDGYRTNSTIDDSYTVCLGPLWSQPE